MKTFSSVKITTVILLLVISVLSQSCNNSLTKKSYNYSTNSALSNFNYKCYFNYVGAYDYDLQQWRTDHPAYRALTTVVINIGYNGAGQIFLSQYGHEKLTYNVINSYFMGDYYSFTWRSGMGENLKTVLRLRKGRPYQLEFLGIAEEKNTSIVYYN